MSFATYLAYLSDKCHSVYKLKYDQQVCVARECRPNNISVISYLRRSLPYPFLLHETIAHKPSHTNQNITLSMKNEAKKDHNITTVVLGLLVVSKHSSCTHIFNVVITILV